MSKRILFGGLFAIGLLAISAGNASAQFVNPFGTPGPFGGSYGGAYTTPNGGFVQQSGYSNPFIGANYSSRSYSNPFTGRTNFSQSYSNAFTGTAFNQFYRNPGYSYYNNAFNNTLYIVSPSYSPLGQTFNYSPLPMYRQSPIIGSQFIGRRR